MYNFTIIFRVENKRFGVITYKTFLLHRIKIKNYQLEKENINLTLKYFFEGSSLLTETITFRTK